MKMGRRLRDEWPRLMVLKKVCLLLSLLFHSGNLCSASQLTDISRISVVLNIPYE